MTVALPNLGSGPAPDAAPAAVGTVWTADSADGEDVVERPEPRVNLNRLITTTDITTPARLMTPVTHDAAASPEDSAEAEDSPAPRWLVAIEP